MKMKTSKLLGLVLIIAGLAVLIFGIVQFTQFNNSVAGKISGVLGDITGRSTEQETQYIIMMIAGGIAALCGIVISKKK
jgi:uncharacterized membrane protein YidH (DUF202 family)